MGSQQPFPLSKLLFMSVKTLAGPLSRWDDCCVFWLVFLTDVHTLFAETKYYFISNVIQRFLIFTLNLQETFTPGKDWHFIQVESKQNEHPKFWLLFISQKVDCFTSCTSLSLLRGQDQVPCDEPWKGAFYFSISSQINLDQNSKQQPIQMFNC